MMAIRGKSGIVNTGNSCYLNSAIQAISNTHDLRNYLLNNQDEIFKILLRNAPKIYNSNPNVPTQLKEFLKSSAYNPELLENPIRECILNGTITFSLIRLLNGIWAHNHTILPTSFTKFFISKSKFTGHTQQDSQEAYSIIIESIKEELGINRPIVLNTEDPVLIKLHDFERRIHKEIEEASHSSIKENLSRQLFNMKRDNPSQALLLDFHNESKKNLLSNASIVNDLFTGFFLSTTECTECGYISNKFDSFSHISVDLTDSYQPTLKECLDKYCTETVLDEDNLWKCDNCCNKVRAKKKMMIWHSPKILVIQLNRYTYSGMGMRKDNRTVDFPFYDLDISNNLCDKRENIYKKYNLYSVINHVGAMNFGHYYSCCKDSDTDIWFLFDDDRVKRITNDSSIMSNNAYLLFYVSN